MKRAPCRRLALLLLVVGGPLPLEPGPANANPSSQELVEVTDIDSLSASPEGRYAVFRTERASVQGDSYLLEWHAVDLASGEVHRIADGGQPIYADPGSVEPGQALWLPDGQSIAFRALVDGAIGVWKASLADVRSVPLIVRDQDVEQVSLSADGHALDYKAGPSREQTRRAERAEYDSGILIDRSVDLAQNLFRGASINGRMASQRLTGFWYDRSGLLWRSARLQRRYDLATVRDQVLGAVQPPPPRAAVPEASSVVASAVSSRGEIVQATWDGFSGSLVDGARDGPKRTARSHCAEAICRSTRISSLLWQPGTRNVLVTFTDRQRRQSLYLWDVDSNHLRLLAAGEGLLAGGRRNDIPCAITAAAALCVAAGPSSPPRLVRIDLGTGKQTMLFDPNQRMRADYRARVEFLSFEGASGTKFAGVLLTPPVASASPSPLFINYYNCEGFLRGGEGDEWPTPALLDAGFAVACLNSPPFRGEQDAVRTYRTALDGVRTLVSDLSRRGLIDPAKVAMGGLSFGSEAAMWVAIYSRLLAAISISSAQVEPAEYWMSAVPGTDHAFFRRKVWGLGTPDETPSQWHLLSPALNARRITAPVLFQLPEQEARRMPELYARLVSAGTPTELYAFPDEAHIKVKPRHRLAVFERNLDWFRYWLQDYRDPDPSKADQYRRWDQLRRTAERRVRPTSSR